MYKTYHNTCCISSNICITKLHFLLALRTTGHLHSIPKRVRGSAAAAAGGSIRSAADRSIAEMVVSDLAVVDDDLFDGGGVTSSRGAARSLSESDVSDLCASPDMNHHENVAAARSHAYSPGEVLLPVGSSHYHHHTAQQSHMGRSSSSTALNSEAAVKPPPKPILPPKLKQRSTMMDRYDSSSSDSPSNLQETFVDADRAAKGFLPLNRSASSVTSKTRAPIAKPVRRSKSQHFHGGKADCAKKALQRPQH